MSNISMLAAAGVIFALLVAMGVLPDVIARILARRGQKRRDRHNRR